jgi:glycosyltransferase involved in cell wall biosynthesis
VLYHQQIAVTQRPGSTTGALMRHHLRHAGRILAVSRNSFEALRALGVPGEKLVLLYNNADTAALARARPAPDAALKALGLPRGPGLILAAGMRRPHKGFDVLLRAARIYFAAGGPGALALLGDAANAEAGHEALLQGLARDPVLAGRAVLAPAQRPLAPWLKRCALFVSASRWEGSPLVVLEAMAAACAVLATRQGAGEVLEHGRTGWLVDSEDPQALAAGMRHLMARPALRRRLGAAARADAARRFSLEAYVQALAGVYDGMADA